MKKRRRIAVILTLAVAFCFMLVQPAMAALVGPTQIPLYGVTLVDSDTGGVDDKEQWGREGGRTYEFTVNQASEYDQLMWQSLSAKMSFDGDFDEANEVLGYTSDDGGTAVFTSWTEVSMIGTGGTYEWVVVDTEFRLTVRDIDDNIVPYSITVDGPSFDLTSLTPNLSDEVYFSVNMEFRARVPSYSSLTAICPWTSPDPVVGDFYPALDVFDCLHTDPGADRLALTSFDYGFFYELTSIVDLDLNEHDAHMEALVGSVQTTVDETSAEVSFLFDDWTPRVTGLNTDHADIRDQLAIMGGVVNNVYTTVSNLSFPELTSLVERVDRLPTNDFLFLMFGLEPFIEDPELQGLFDIVRDNSPLYQAITPLNDKADALQEAVSNITLDLTPVETVVQTNATTIQGAVSEVDTKAGAIQSAVGLLGTQADGISQDVNTTMGYAYNTDIAVANVGSTVDAIQTTVNQISQNVIGVAGQAESIGLAVDSANNTLGTVNTTTGNIQTAVASLTDMVNTLQLAVEYQAELDIQLKDIASEEESKGKDALTIKSFLAAFKENGMLVPVATGDVSVFAILDGSTPSAVPVDFVPTSIGGVVGIMRLDLDLTNFETMPKVLLIEASYNGNPGNIKGAKLFTVGLHTE